MQEERRRADICKDVLALRPLFRSYVLLRKDIRSFLQRTWHIESPGHPWRTSLLSAARLDASFRFLCTDHSPEHHE